MRIHLLVWLLFGGFISFSQHVRVSPEKMNGRENTNILFKTNAYSQFRLEASSKEIPFFDNFNYGTTPGFTNNWQASGVELIKLPDAPSAYGVKFNGIKADKTKYNTDSTLRVKTDELVSTAFNFSTLDLSKKNASVQFSWQGGGNGNIQPDSAVGDLFIFSYRDKNMKWQELWRAPSAKNYNKARYYNESFTIDSTFISDSVLFRFESYGQSFANTSAYYLTNFTIQVSGSLPFWDDFSNAAATVSHFKTNTGAHVNNNLAINQPSVNVASFDGLDDYGNPYYRSTVVEIGEADSLVSWPINIDSIQTGISKKDSLRFSFYYQKGGLGETPDFSEGDSLVLLFYNKSGQWKSVWHSSFTQAVDSSTFYQVLLKVNDSSFFHDNFKFKFFNYARLSGSFDVWNIDYITLDTITKANIYRAVYSDTLYYSDVAISKAPNSIFTNYTSIPVNHLKSSLLTFSPFNSFSVSSLTVGDLNVQIKQSELINNEVLESVTIPLPVISKGFTKIDHKLSNNTLLDSIQKKELNPQKTPFKITVKVEIDLVNPVNSTQYSFLSNDTASSTFIFDNYYAYDDGTYEFGVMLEQEKALQALQYETYKQDTLTAIDFSFPHIGYNLDQSPFYLKVWADNNGQPGKEIYSQYEKVRYSVGLQPFTQYLMNKNKPPVVVSGKFYVGYQQVNGFSNALRVGYDANNQNQDKVFFDNNRGYGWSQYRNLPGSLMIHPVFAGKAVNARIEEKANFRMIMFPNPNNSGSLEFNAQFGWVEIIDFNGTRRLLEYDTQKVDVSSLNAGLYFIKAFKDNTIYSQKLFIQSK